jgi:hypothetical protein
MTLTTPPGDRLVSLPPVTASGRVAPSVPFSGSSGNGS